MPPVKPTEQAIELELPEGGTLTAKASAVLHAAASGELAPGQAAQMIAALGTVAKIIETDDLAQRIKALEDRGVARLLAEPNLIARSGEKASFLAGGEFPISRDDALAGPLNGELAGDLLEDQIALWIAP